VSTIHHYKSNLRDTYFNLFEVLDVGRTTLGSGPFDALDEATARESLRGIERHASTTLAESFAASDREGAELLPDGSVRLPESLKASLHSFWDAGWQLMELPVRLGGAGAPPSMIWAAFEFISGANATAGFYLFGTFIAKIIDRLGTASQRARYLPQMIEKRWGGAMVLTEPDAGSDVGNARAKARHVEGDLWEIEGTKRFITNGDFDAVDNVVHLVLARPEGAAGGTKGLSMFIVPKYWVEADGAVGARNGWRVTKLEKKMGIKASATCEVAYGDGDVPCRGLLVGEVHDGIRQMFHVIEQARMGVGVKSMATLSTAYLNALAYAKDRVQGADLPRAMDKASPRVAIIQHADVRRMLMQLKSHAEGMRALALWTAWLQDQVEIQGGHGASGAKDLDRLNDMMLPLVKGFFSERAHELLAIALQTYGGSGYVMDFPIEQYMRDQKIDTLYEGTTQIQALDLFFRKIARDGGATLQGLLGRVRETLTSAEGGGALSVEREFLGVALGEVEAIFMTMLGKAQESVHHVGVQGNRILISLAELVTGWLLIRHAAVALARVDGASEDDRVFYAGKVESARWFAREVLPNISHARAMIERSSVALMDIDDRSF
jgi:alkylation response protein AidB-like acyl-CoA dehydrogenase